MSEAQLRIEISAVADQARSEIEALKSQIDGLNKTTQSIALGEQMQRVGGQMQSVGSSIVDTMMGLGGSVVSTYSEIETATANFGKAANMSDGDLTAMRDRFIDLSKVIPKPIPDLLAIGEAAAKMGVQGQESLLGFTELVSQMSVGFDMAAADTGNSMGAISASFGMIEKGLPDMARMSAFGNVVNNLGDNMAVTESQVLEFVKRAGGAVKDFGINENQVAAFGASIIELGMAPDIAANAFSSFAGVLGNATKAPDKAQAAFEDLGFSVEDLQQRMLSGDGTQAIQDVFNAVSERGPEALGIFNDIIGAGFDDELARIAGSSEGVGKGFQFMEQSLAGGGSTLAQSADIMGGTFEAKMQLMQNSFGGLATAIADSGLMDMLAGLVEGFTGFVNKLTELNPNILKAGVAISGIVTGIGLLLIPLGAIVGIIGTIIAAGGLGVIFAGVGAVLATLGSVFLGVILPVLVFVGLVVAAFLIWRNVIQLIFAKVQELGGVGAFLAEVWMGAKHMIVSAFQAILQAATSVLQGLWQSISQTFVNIVTGIQIWMAEVRNAMVLKWNEIKTAVIMAIDGIVTGIQSKFSTIGTSISTVMTSVRMTMIAAWMAIRTAVVASIQAMIASIRSTMAQIPSAISSSLSAAAGVVTGFIGSFRSAGVGLISALVAGIKSKIGEIKSAVSEALSAARALLPFSDAKEGPFSDLTYSGGQLMATIAKGVLGNEGAVPSAMSQVFAPVIDLAQLVTQSPSPAMGMTPPPIPSPPAMGMNPPPIASPPAMGMTQPLIPAAQAMGMNQPKPMNAQAMAIAQPTPMNARDQAMSGGGAVTNNSQTSAPTTIQFILNGGDGDDIMAKLRANQSEIIRMIETGTARRDRTMYSNA